MLAAADHRERHLLSVRRAHDEDRMRRWFFQRLQESVECVPRQPVRLIDDVDLVRTSRRRQVDLVPQVAHIVDTSVRRCVDLDQVQRRPCGHLDARVAVVARLSRIAGATCAVQSLGQQPRRRGLASPARPAEEVRMRDAARDDRALQRARRGLLADEVAKSLGAVLAVEGLVFRHRNSQWSRTSASFEDPQLAPRFPTRAQMAAAPPGFSLPLLPSGPDGVRRPELRRSRPSTPFAAAGSENPDLKRWNSVRLRRIAGSGYRQHPT